MKKIFKILFSRMTIIALIIIVQLVGIIITFNYFSSAIPVASILVPIIEVVVLVEIINRDMTSELKLPWLMIILIVPVGGIVIYYIFSKNYYPKKYNLYFQKLFKNIKYNLVQHEEDSSILNEYSGFSNYIKNTTDYGVMGDSKTTYFSTGETFLEDLLENLKKANNYIFLEYFIIEQGVMFDSILEILKEKVKSGVEVRLMYDDIGCIGKISASFNKKLQSYGIKCVKFRPFVPVVTALHNNRDHRKITVIDGQIAYVGGINLADEYINKKVLYGKWKDSALKIEGTAALSYTAMFLENFDLQLFKQDEYSRYFKNGLNTENVDGYVQAFCDGPKPIYPELISENIYLNMINQAKHTIWIATPYLILDSLIKNALISASKRGVKVRICTPHIPDKKAIFVVTQYNYIELLKNGVEIYEYKPGFLHTKNVLIDDEVAIVGTVNLDYRSLIHHFECGIVLYKTNCIKDIEKDFIEIKKVSIKMDSTFNLKWYKKIFARLVHIFSPLI